MSGQHWSEGYGDTTTEGATPPPARLSRRAAAGVILGLSLALWLLVGALLPMAL